MYILLFAPPPKKMSFHRVWGEKMKKKGKREENKGKREGKRGRGKGRGEEERVK